MLSKGAPAAAPGRDAESRSRGNGRTGARGGKRKLQGYGVQVWPDGSRYEGEFLDGLKHGKGKYTCSSGECYEGSFYKEYKHGEGVYSWPSGQKFIGKFYLNRREGYGQLLFPHGADFKGLYHIEQRLGPGVMTYPDGRQDVGLWDRDRLIRLCTSVEDGFSLKNFPEYAAYMDPSAATDYLTQPPHLPSGLGTGRLSGLDIEHFEEFIYPCGIEAYSTNGDHLPLPPGRRRELDKHFHGDLWEPDPFKGIDRDPLSQLPFQARMRANIHKHRLQVSSVGWDVAAVLSLNRDSFGPKGPLEISSELFIQKSSQGDRQGVIQILKEGLVHPNVADSQGHTALIAATVNCHDNVIDLLTDMGASINQLNCEGMSALAVCHILYYPFQSLHTTLAEPPAKTQLLRSQLACVSSVDFTADTPRPQTNDTVLSNQTNQNPLSDKTTDDLTEQRSHHSSKVSNNSELINEQQGTDLIEPETPVDTEHLKEEETEEKGQGGEERHGKKRDSNRNSEKDEENSCKKNEENKREENEIKEEFQFSEEVEKDIERSSRDFHEDVEGKEDGRRQEVTGVEHSIQVLDGHIPLCSVQWKEYGATGKNKDSTQKATFDSARSINSYNIHVTEEVMQRSAEALSRTGIPHHDTQETVRKMAAMKIEHRLRLKTLKLLLNCGADPNECRMPMPVLFLAIMAADTEAVPRLLQCGARTDIPLPPEGKGLYPLHVAAALPGPSGPRITKMLLDWLADPDARACDQDEIYEHDKEASEPPRATGKPNPREGGRTALHVACQRDSDYQNASEVVALLLSHRASTDLLWSGHSPLSLAIASGNELAVEELLKGGADPNILLGRTVGTALCALANINYHLCGNRAKLLDMLVKAGADILMPIIVGDIEGTAVDYAYYSFSQDSRIANTPFHALNVQERKTFSTRYQLLTMMRNLLRQTYTQREREKRLTEEGAISPKGPVHSDERMPSVKFCYHCGRSASVKLIESSCCHMVFFCSRTCKLKAKDHKEVCTRVSRRTKPHPRNTEETVDDIQKRVVLKSQRNAKPKTVPNLLSVRVKPLTVTEHGGEGQAKPSQHDGKLEENYSFI